MSEPFIDRPASSDPGLPSASEAALNIQVQWLRLLRLSGELDLATAPLIRQAGQILAGQPVQDLVVDLSAVTFIDAAGIGALITVAAAQQNAGAQLTFTGLSALAHEVFTLAQATVLLEAVPSAPRSA